MNTQSSRHRHGGSYHFPGFQHNTHHPENICRSFRVPHPLLRHRSSMMLSNRSRPMIPYPPSSLHGALFLTRVCLSDLDVLPSGILFRSPQACSIRLNFVVHPRDFNLVCPAGYTFFQQHPPRLCVHQHHRARYVFATYVAPRDIDATHVTSLIARKMQPS